MSHHYVERCSCGAVSQQCRCPSQDKAQTVVQDGCTDCQRARLQDQARHIHAPARTIKEDPCP